MNTASPPPQKYEATITIDVTGDDTGDRYQGVFRILTRLTQRQKLLIDQLRRQFLGAQPNGARPDADADARAKIFANLSVRVIEAPAWWTSADGGLEICDDNVPAEVYVAAEKVVAASRAVLVKNAEDARKELSEKGPISPPPTV